MIDRYTKSVLTVIAVALCVLAIQNAIRPSPAQFGAPQKVQLCDEANCIGLGAFTNEVAGRPVRAFALPTYQQR